MSALMSGAMPALAARASISIASGFQLAARAQFGRHESPSGDGDDVFGRFLIGAPTREHDLTRDLHALADHEDDGAGFCGLHVLDAKVERGIARRRALCRIG